jgi:exopolysaccharide production protein ExoQ
MVLLRYDAATRPDASPGLWIPVLWLSIVASRLPSQWVGIRRVATQAYEEGSTLDRIIYSVLIVMALGVLMSRSVKWSDIIARNIAAIGLLLFALLSVAWSDFPLIAFKRWFRDLGIYLGILIVLSDPRPLEAVQTVLRRLCFLLVPLSILLHKYFPASSRQYDVWTGQPSYVGATTSKNMLGLLCLVSGLFFVWDTLTRWRQRHDAGVPRILLVNSAFIGMTLWLLTLASSATSSACLVLGCLVLVAARGEVGPRRAALLMLPIPLGICLYAVLSGGFGVDFGAVLAPILGRDATLTGRTEIWRTLVGMQASPLIGAGYESFWIGPRLQRVWESSVGMINEAHNGYLQVYLNLGAMGLMLLFSLLIGTYWRVWKGLRAFPGIGSFGLALWTVLVVYNVTEAAFLGGMLWTALLMMMGSLDGNRVQEQPASSKTAAHSERRHPKRRVAGVSVRALSSRARAPMLVSARRQKL